MGSLVKLRASSSGPLLGLFHRSPSPGLDRVPSVMFLPGQPRRGLDDCCVSVQGIDKKSLYFLGIDEHVTKTCGGGDYYYPIVQMVNRQATSVLGSQKELGFKPGSLPCHLCGQTVMPGPAPWGTHPRAGVARGAAHQSYCQVHYTAGPIPSPLTCWRQFTLCLTHHPFT